MRAWLVLLLPLLTAATWADLDDDGFGDPDLPCEGESAACVDNADDCDDGDARSNPLGTEVPGDAVDQDCDGVDDCYVDLDGDDWGSTDVVPDGNLDCDDDSDPTAGRDGDCDDDPATGADRFPTQAEVCNGVDDNCDGRIDEVTSDEAVEFYLDADGDGWGDVTRKLLACGEPLGYAPRAGDCDDQDPRAFPDNTEICDGIDNDCEAGIDEDDAIDALTWFQDGDADGYGDCDVRQVSCSEPTTGGDWVKAGQQCDPDDTVFDPGGIVCPPEACGCCDHPSRPGLTALATLLSAVSLRRRRAAGG